MKRGVNKYDELNPPKLVAKVNDVERTEGEAETYFDQLHISWELSDDDFDAVVGGAQCFESQLTVNGLPEGKRIEVNKEKRCPTCGTTIGYSRRILRVGAIFKGKEGKLCNFEVIV